MMKRKERTFVVVCDAVYYKHIFNKQKQYKYIFKVNLVVLMMFFVRTNKIHCRKNIYFYIELKFIELTEFLSHSLY